MLRDVLFREMCGIEISQRVADGYINATNLSKAYENATGKKREPKEWLATQRTKAFVELVSSRNGIPESELIQVTKGGVRPGTWLHPKLVVAFGTWLSVEFEYQVSEWVQDWLTNGRNNIQLNVDRTDCRGALKDETRKRLNHQIRVHLEKIDKYNDLQYRDSYYRLVHNEINIALTGETSQQMRYRLSELLDRPFSEKELIRDYFPAVYLQRYTAVCEATANFISKRGINPLKAVGEAVSIVLPRGYIPTPINFLAYIGQLQPHGQDCLTG